MGLIIRGVAFEFRSKSLSPKWRNLWDWCICVGSFIPALLLGVAFANLGRGLPIDGNMMFTGNLLTLLNPYALLGGVVSVAVFLLHGSNFLSMKLEDELKTRVEIAGLETVAASLDPCHPACGCHGIVHCRTGRG